MLGASQRRVCAVIQREYGLYRIAVIMLHLVCRYVLAKLAHCPGSMMRRVGLRLPGPTRFCPEAR